jgi:hypothetical protein
MHQAVGALEMVGLAAPAHMLRSMEGSGAEVHRAPRTVHRSRRRQGGARRLRADRIPRGPAGGQGRVAAVAVRPVQGRAGPHRRRPRAPCRPVGHGLALERLPDARRRDAGLRAGRARAHGPGGAQDRQGGRPRRRPRTHAGEPGPGRRPGRAPAEGVLEGGRRLLRGDRAGPAARRRLREARGFARAAAVRLAGQGRHQRVRAAGAGPRVLLRAGPAGPSRRCAGPDRRAPGPTVSPRRSRWTTPAAPSAASIPRC